MLAISIFEIRMHQIDLNDFFIWKRMGKLFRVVRAYIGERNVMSRLHKEFRKISNAAAYFQYPPFCKRLNLLEHPCIETIGSSDRS